MVSGMRFEERSGSQAINKVHKGSGKLTRLLMGLVLDIRSFSGFLVEILVKFWRIRREKILLGER
jgi:hypothetical protein